MKEVGKRTRVHINSGGGGRSLTILRRESWLCKGVCVCPSVLSPHPHEQ